MRRAANWSAISGGAPVYRSRPLALTIKQGSYLMAPHRLRRTCNAAVALVALFGLFACVTKGGRMEPQVSKAEAATQYAHLGIAYLQQGSQDLALEKLQHALELDPNNADAHQYLGELYRQTGDAELAEKHFRRALRLDKRNPSLQNNYGVFLCGEHRYEEAESRFLKAAHNRSYERPEEAYENAALCMLQRGDTKKAEKYFRSALDANPRRAPSLYQMASLKLNVGDNLQARAFLERHIAVVGYTPENLWLGVQIEEALGDTASADEYADLLRQKFPRAEQTRRLPSLERR